MSAAVTGEMPPSVRAAFPAVSTTYAVPAIQMDGQGGFTLVHQINPS